jgi:DNA-binding CsgD family transcriptional regulator
LTDVDLRRARLPALVAEFIVLRALILAASGEIDRARSALAKPGGRFYDGQIQALRDCTTAVIAEQDPGSTTDSSALIRDVLERGQIDTFVSSYRAYPDLLRLALELPKWSRAVEEILIEACDTNLSDIGFATSSNASSDDELSPRETEVMKLLVQGLRNKEIAQHLFISDVTVKAHLRRAYEKLGVNSRTAALVAFQRRYPS